MEERTCPENVVAPRLLRPECQFPGCEKRVKYRALCAGHAEQRRQGKVLKPLREKRPNRLPPPPCTFDGCEKPSHAHHLCEGHYDQKRRGRTLAPLQPRRPSHSSRLRDELGRRHCTTCAEWLTLELFYRATAAPDGYHFECRACSRARTVASVFNLPPHVWTEMHAAQDGACAICHETQSIELAVDHDHRCCPGANSCGRCIRGLLCWACNTAIGQMRDEPARLRAAAAYLEASRASMGDVGQTLTAAS